MTLTACTACGVYPCQCVARRQKESELKATDLIYFRRGQHCIEVCISKDGDLTVVKWSKSIGLNKLKELADLL